MRDHSVNCDALQQKLREGRQLTRTQAAHMDACEACMDALLTAALEEKPDVTIPADFAARVTANLPACPVQQAVPRRPRHWGLAAAAATVTVLLVVCFAGPASANSWVSIAFVMLVAMEIAGLALWLGPRWMEF